MDKNEYYLMRENIFYYLVKNDLSIKRNNIISDIIGDEKETYYVGSNGYVRDIRFARFWKNDKLKISKENLLMKMSLKDFMNIDFTVITKDFVVLRNKELKNKEIKLKSKRDKIRSKYKAISSYNTIPEKDYYNWKSCRKCGLKPLIWEFNNGRSTACGCGENEYVHHSISAESIMSYIKRNNGSALNFDSYELMNNWNEWVLSGLDKFKSRKDSNIW